ncbi:MAG: trehalose-phosphatase, partial [Desulfovermiculus sp.]
MANKKPLISRSLFEACIFDLDGVVTTTARLHAEAWKELFDAFLQENVPTGEYTPFDIQDDYLNYVDGKPRYQGVKSFLDSRGIELHFGNIDDDPSLKTVCGLGNRKNEIFVKRIQEQGVDVYDTSIDLLLMLRSRGFQTAVVSSSKNCLTVLDAANIGQLFDVKVDGIDIEYLDLKGKPEPDAFLEAARQLDVDPSRSILVEDAISGVQAGRKGGFGLVVGVNRGDAARQLKQAGADLVLSDLGELRLEDDLINLPNGLIYFEEIRQLFEDKRVAVFLDYDGTLTPIVSRPEDARLSGDMRDALKDLTQKCTVSIISGRGLHDARELVDVPGLYFAGSHGFEIKGPNNVHMELEEARELIPVLDESEQALRKELKAIPGSQVERKKYSLAVHYRNVSGESVAEVENIVDRAIARFGRLRKGVGKKVFEIRPDIFWDKGQAVLWLLNKLELDHDGVIPVYIGDDVTDEDAFEVFAKKGITLIVGDESRFTHAKYRLESVDEVKDFLFMLQVYLRNWRTWSLVYGKYSPQEEGLREALCTLGNGYFATRGAWPESRADAIHYPGTYLAGGYNRLQSEISGRIIENEDLVNMPNWLCLNFRHPDEAWFNPDDVEILNYRQELDIKNGILSRTVHFRDHAGRETKVFHRRMVCMHRMHMAALELSVVPVNWSGEIEIQTALDGQVTNSGVKRYQALNNQHLEPVFTSQIDEKTIGLHVRTKQSNICIAQAARTEIFKEGKPLRVERECIQKPGYMAQKFRVQLTKGKGLDMEKVVSMYTSRDQAISEPYLEASDSALQCRRFSPLLQQHTM